MKAIALFFVCLLFVLAAVSCAAADASAIPPGVEVVNIETDRTIFESLEQVEDFSTIIVEAVASNDLGQEVNTTYDNKLKRDLPDYGFTNWEIEVKNVFKGDVKAGDRLMLLQEYYVWTYPDGKKQLVALTALKPPVKNREYLLFLKYDDKFNKYYPVGDYEGMFALPSDEMQEKTKAGTLAQDDFDVYDYEELPFLIPIFSEAVEKYFS